MIGIPLGLLYANAGEWWIHKRLLHELGRARGSFWAFHWYDHHRASRLHGFRDSSYRRTAFSRWDAQTKEIAALAVASLIHLPLVRVAPLFTGAVLFSAVNYYRVHKKSHLHPDWAREHLPWHYDHHMGPNQDANWCVSFPLFDYLMGTRERYAGTPREAKDLARKAARELRARREPAP